MSNYCRSGDIPQVDSTLTVSPLTEAVVEVSRFGAILIDRVYDYYYKQYEKVKHLMWVYDRGDDKFLEPSKTIYRFGKQPDGEYRNPLFEEFIYMVKFPERRLNKSRPRGIANGN